MLYAPFDKNYQGNFFLQLATQIWVKKILLISVELQIYACCRFTSSVISLQTSSVTGNDFSCNLQ